LPKEYTGQSENECDVPSFTGTQLSSFVFCMYPTVSDTLLAQHYSTCQRYKRKLQDDPDANSDT